MEYGFITLLPTLLVLGLAIWSRRTLESVLAGALFSASAFGSHACFYSDSTVLSAQGAGCTTYEHAITQLPYALLGAAVAAILFVLVA